MYLLMLLGLMVTIDEKCQECHCVEELEGGKLKSVSLEQPKLDMDM